MMKQVAKKLIILSAIVIVLNTLLEMAKDYMAVDRPEEFPSFEQLIKQEDPGLSEIIRTKYLRQPPGLPYNLAEPQTEDPQLENNQEIRKILKDKKNGFFVECGAFTGEFYSNSIFWERFMGWTGILIEPVPEFFNTLISKNRNSWTTKLCLSPKTYPNKVSFQVNGWGSAIAKYSKQSGKHELITAQCVPLYSILLALNITKIDYFILDVEALEFLVLKTIPWDKVNITVIMVEVQFLEDELEDLVLYMKKQGYKLHNNDTTDAMDYIFYHPLLIP